MSENQEQRIRRLERAVRGLTIAFIVSICVSIYAFYQITSIMNTIPSYHELKEDVKSIRKMYNSSMESIPDVKKKIGDGYDYTKEKVSNGYSYTKKKTGDVIDYFKGEDKEDQKSKGKNQK